MNGEADLAAVGVAGEHEVDERKAGVLDDAPRRSRARGT